METKGKDKDREGEGRQSVKPHGCTWRSRKRLWWSPEEHHPYRSSWGSSESQGRVGREERCRKQGRVQLGQI